MCTTNMNAIPIEDLEIFNRVLGVEFLINDGKIVGTEDKK